MIRGGLVGRLGLAMMLGATLITLKPLIAAETSRNGSRLRVNEREDEAGLLKLTALDQLAP